MFHLCFSAWVARSMPVPEIAEHCPNSMNWVMTCLRHLWRELARGWSCRVFPGSSWGTCLVPLRHIILSLRLMNIIYIFYIYIYIYIDNMIIYDIDWHPDRDCLYILKCQCPQDLWYTVSRHCPRCPQYHCLEISVSSWTLRQRPAKAACLSQSLAAAV